MRRKGREERKRGGRERDEKEIKYIEEEKEIGGRRKARQELENKK